MAHTSPSWRSNSSAISRLVGIASSAANRSRRNCCPRFPLIADCTAPCQQILLIAVYSSHRVPHRLDVLHKGVNEEFFGGTGGTRRGRLKLPTGTHAPQIYLIVRQGHDPQFVPVNDVQGGGNGHAVPLRALRV